MNLLKKMRLIMVVLSVVLLANCAATKNNLTESSEKPETYMWLLKSDTATVYLLGSVHTGKKENYPLHEKIENAYVASDYLVVEANVSKDKQADLQMKTIQLAMFTDGKTLKSVLPEKTYALVDAEFKKLGYSVASFDMFEPWIVSLSLVSMRTMKMGFDASLGIDQYFLGKANEGKKEILELESIDFQLTLLDSMPLEKQITSLEETCTKSYEDNQKLFDDIYACWKEADAVKMDKLMDLSDKNSEFNQIIFKQRDAKMAEKIIEFLKTDKKYFVVVGAGHLTGEDSVVDLLKKKGYKVIQQ